MASAVPMLQRCARHQGRGAFARAPYSVWHVWQAPTQLWVRSDPVRRLPALSLKEDWWHPFKADAVSR